MFKLLWRLTSAVAVGLAALAAEQALKAGWRTVTGRRPPQAPEHPDSSWGRPLAWAVASGAAAGAARLVAMRAAASYYRKSTGHLPRELREAVEED